jgi:hypothetical protein
MTPGPVPSVFKEGWLRLNKKIPFLSGADGVVGNFKQKLGALREHIRRLRDLLQTTPPRLLTVDASGTPPLKGLLLTGFQAIFSPPL